MGRQIAIAQFGIGLAILIVTADSYAAPHGPPPPGSWDPLTGLTIGPSLAWVGRGDGTQALGVGGELSYYYVLHTPLAAWITAGTRLWTDGDMTATLPYAEVGLSFLVAVVGVGYTAGLGGEQVPSHAVHLFCGLAIPLWVPAAGHILYVEPYYRPAWDVAGEEHPVGHELGAMLKWFFDLGALGDH